jgi:hypothetical protein
LSVSLEPVYVPADLVGIATTCTACGSSNRTEFSAEVNIHPADRLSDADEIGVFVFQRILVCLDCGSSSFTTPAPELARLASSSILDDSQERMGNMTALEVKATIQPGLLRGNGLQSSCKVGVLTKEVPGEAPVVLERYIRSVEMQLPKGDYQLEVDDRIYKAHRFEVFWSVSLVAVSTEPSASSVTS